MGCICHARRHAYYLIANILKGLIERGSDAWLSLPLLWCLVMGTAFLLLGPISLLKLARARLREAAYPRLHHRQVEREATEEA